MSSSVTLRLSRGDASVEVSVSDSRDLPLVLESLGAPRGLDIPTSRSVPTSDRTLGDAMDKYISECTYGRTRDLYMETLVAVSRHVDLGALPLSELDRSWVVGLDESLRLRGLSPGTRSIHLRSLRTAISHARLWGWTDSSPFSGYRLPKYNIRHRALPVEALRALISLDLTGVYAYHRDMFLISFGLVGINCGDLYDLPPITGGRAEYIRAKTKRPYSIRVEPEISELIERHRGAGRAVDLSDRYSYARTANVRANCALKVIGAMPYVARDGVERPICPELSTYWARHSWATIAANLDIPKDTIAAALGHGVRSVTDIYIDFDRAKVDEANRKVIDYVWYSR